MSAATEILLGLSPLVADAGSTLPDWLKWAGGISGMLAIVGAIVGLTRYITQIHLQAQLTVKDGELQTMKERLGDIHAEFKRLQDEVANTRIAGTAALIKKAQIDSEFDLVASAMLARAASIYVPEPTSKPAHLVFLSIRGEAAAQIRRYRNPVGRGIAGYVYTHGTPHLANSAHTDTNFFPGIDKISRFVTGGVVAAPIRHGGQVIGVVQFMNKRDDQPFTRDDLQTASRFADQIAGKVHDFIADYTNYLLLGITPQPDLQDGVILFCDLTGSSVLASVYDHATYTDLINQYLEAMCEVAMVRGGVVDNYIGDCAMIRFNVPNRIDRYHSVAVATALEMQAEFRRLKQSWLENGLTVQKLFNRIGMAAGPLFLVNVGHPQQKRITVLGDAANTASHLCTAADRTRNVTLIDGEIYKHARGAIQASDVTAAVADRIKGMPITVYEVTDAATPGV